MTRARDLAAFVSNADGDIKFDTDTLFIDSSANRVGISTTTVNRKLEVAGNNNGGAKTNYIRVTDTDTTATAANQMGGIEFFSSDSSGGAGISASIEALYAGSGGGGELTFNTNATSGGTLTEAMRIDESGKVRLQQSSVVTASTDADDLVIEKTGDTGLSILSTTTGRIYFGDAANDDAGSIRYVHSDNSMRFETDDGERMRLLAAGGLTFNGDTAAANALDDYEEGSWTPQATIDGSNVTTTSSGNRYTKIGRQVFLQASIIFSSGTNNGLVNITGVPFNPSINSYFRGIMVNDLFDESGNYYGIINTSGTIIPRVGPVNQSDGSRTLAGTDIANSINAGLYVGFVYTVG